MTSSLLLKKRLAYQPSIPPLLQNLHATQMSPSGKKSVLSNELSKVFPHTDVLSHWTVEKGSGKHNRPLRVGVLFSGGQAAGGHNVIAGLYAGLVEIHPESLLIGFLDGPQGIIENRCKTLSAGMIDSVRNVGGFDLIGSGRTKIETPDQFQNVAHNVIVNQLDALIIIGGDDSNTNAAFLSEYFYQHNIATKVMGCPKTIDGDLRSQDIEISFGFDSATKTYSELIGNIAKDALSAKKYYHFIKLMGRSASHITLECALATCPNLALIGEEKRSLSQIVDNIVNLVIERKKKGKDYGIVLLPEGLIEFIPEFYELIRVINLDLVHLKDPKQALDKLEGAHRALFGLLPEKIQEQLLLERDSHGNVQLSQIDTEQLIIELVKTELQKRNLKINTQAHFFGYEGRACFPTNFDANYCYALGRLGALAARDGATGVILAIKNLHRPVSEWIPKAIPIVELMGFEMRGLVKKPVVLKTLVDLKGKPYQRLIQSQKSWRCDDCFQMPGPIQFFGEGALTDSIPISLTL